MIIRRLEEKDIVKSIELLKQIHKYMSVNQSYPALNLVDVEMEYRLSIGSKSSIIYVAINEDKLIGIIWFVKGSYWYNKSICTINERLWHTDENLRHTARVRVMNLLRKTVENEYKDYELNIGTHNGFDIGDHMKKYGYELFAKHYRKAVL